MANTINLGNGEWATKDGNLLAYNDENGNFKPIELDFTRASTATNVNRLGLLESARVSEPRIDFSDNANGSLLLEPQSTNLLTHSEEINNGVWGKNNTTVISNVFTAPDGNLTADSLAENIFTSSQSRISRSITTTLSSSYTFSCYVNFNGVTNRQFYIGFNIGTASTSAGKVYVNSDGTIFTKDSPLNAKATNVGNGFYRIEISAISGGGTGVLYYGFAVGDNETYTSDGTAVISVWGAQLEALPYATSYIKTEGSTVTRIQDTASKSGLSSLINSSQGVLYVEIENINNQPAANNHVGISDGSNTNRVQFVSVVGSTSLIFRMIIIVNNVNVADKTWAIGSITYPIKASISYKENNFQLHVNGSKVGEDLIGNTFPVNTLNTLKFSDGNNTVPFQGKVKNLQIYNTALTDSELITLTTI